MLGDSIRCSLCSMRMPHPVPNLVSWSVVPQTALKVGSTVIMGRTRGLLMARFFRAAIVTACFLYAGSAFAQGGACPTAANYLNASTGSQVTLSSLGVTKCYYISAAGSDSNSGTSESSPWLHAPGMPQCSNTCAGVNPTAGFGFIFRGGDTWHMGNTSASPYTGGAWIFGNNGTSSNPIYWGVDPGWYTGGSWVRPILTGDNPVCGPLNLGGICSSGTIGSPAYNLSQYYVSSCAYQISPSTGGSSNTILSMYSISYNIVDNFELTGLCQQDTGGTKDDAYVRYGSGYALYFYNLYLHGWTHVKFADVNGGSGCTASTVCLGISLFEGGANRTPDDTLRYAVMDGSDSDPVGAQGCYCDFWNVAYSYIGNQSGVITRYQHLFHDNLYEYWYENGHGNVLESVGDAPGANATYNNVVRHINTTGDPGDPLYWPYPPVGTTNYWFNNLTYDVTNMEYFNVGQNSGKSQGTLTVFNNTFQNNVISGGGIFGCTSPNPFVWTAANNHYITEGSSAYNSTKCTTGGKSDTTSLLMNNATATSDGYTSSETYAYSPTSSSSPTAGAGTNEGSLNGAFCSALTTAAASDPTLSDAATACQSDTRYACTYNASNHTMTCPARVTVGRPTGAWHVGAYQYSSTQASLPNAPTSLTATVSSNQ